MNRNKSEDNVVEDDDVSIDTTKSIMSPEERDELWLQDIEDEPVPIQVTAPAAELKQSNGSSSSVTRQRLFSAPARIPGRSDAKEQNPSKSGPAKSSGCSK